jgi:crotonobetainyl-CoA:carnitine CoA-transferase CaiB-like acyl-CoA transferase
MTSPTVLPLRGTTVLDVSRMLPGAVASRMLEDLGARVIKIEQPGAGDPMRTAPPLVGGVGAVFCAFYRGAESVCLDLKEPSDAAAFRELSGKAQVLIESFRPGTLARWGVGPAKLLSVHPALVVCSLSGFGNRAPDGVGVAHDINVVAWSGLLSLLPGDGVPRIQMADVAAGLMACSAVLAALLGRERTGRGGWIEQPLSGGPMPFLTLPMAEAAGGGGGFAEDYLAGACPSYRLYTCGDGARLAVGAVETKFWVELVQLLALPELVGRGRDGGAAGRDAAERVQRKIEQQPRAHWLALFRERGLPVTPAHKPEDALDDLRVAGWIEQTPVPGGGTLALPAPYLRSLGVTPARPAPRLGEHTASILEEFGIAGRRP